MQHPMVSQGSSTLSLHHVECCHWSRLLLLVYLQDQNTAKSILDRWKEAGAESDPNQLRKLFLRQSLVPITASVVQVWCGSSSECVQQTQCTAPQPLRC